MEYLKKQKQKQNLRTFALVKIALREKDLSSPTKQNQKMYKRKNRHFMKEENQMTCIHTHPQSPGNYRYNLPTRHLEGSLYTLVPKEMTVLMALAGSHS